MLLKKLGASNYFVAMIFLLVITILLVISAFIVTAFMPGSLARLPYQYEMESVHEFEPWSFEIEELGAAYPDGGIIVNLKQTGRYRSDLLLGEGTYYHRDELVGSNNTGGIFIVTELEYFEEMKGDNIFKPVEDKTLLNHLEEISEAQKGIPTLWEGAIPLTFHKENNLVYFYFISPDGNPIMPPSSNYSDLTVFGAFLVYLLFLAILVMVITMLSPDHRYSKYWVQLGETRPRFFSQAIILPIIALLIANKLSVDFFGYPDIYLALGYILVIFILILANLGNKIDYLDFGLRRDKLKYGYFLAIVSAVLIILGVRGLPAGFFIDGTDQILQLPMLFFLLALPREMIWRGYIQAILSRRFGVNLGLILMAILATAVHSTSLALTDPWMFLYPYTYLEIALLVPGTAVIFGYLYLRTENILACAVLHSLILWLPGIILY